MYAGSGFIGAERFDLALLEAEIRDFRICVMFLIGVEFGLGGLGS